MVLIHPYPPERHKENAIKLKDAAVAWNRTVCEMLDLVRKTGFDWCETSPESFRPRFRQYDQDREALFQLVMGFAAEVQKRVEAYLESEKQKLKYTKQLQVNLDH